MNECPYKWWGAYKYICADKSNGSWDLVKLSKKVLCVPHH